MARRTDLRERILDAAIQVLGENGPRPRLFTTIAERANVSRPTLYRHFSDRADLYDSLLRQELTRVVADVADRARTTTSPLEDYVDLVVALVREARNHRALTAVVARHPEIMATQLTRIVPTVLEIAEPVIAPISAEAVASGRWPDIDVRLAIIWTTRLILSLVTTPLSDEDDETMLRASVESLLDVARAIAVEPRQPLA